MNHKNRTMESYNRIAKDYSKKHKGKSFMADFYEDDLIALEDNRIVLDLGCGAGRDSRFLSQIFDHVLAVDSSQGMLDQTDRASNISHRCIDALNLDIEESSCSAIWCNAVLHHLTLQEQKEILSKMRFWLKNNGAIYVSIRMDIDNAYDTEYLNAPRYYAKIPETLLVDLLESNNFSKLSISSMKDTNHKEKIWIYFRATAENSAN